MEFLSLSWYAMACSTYEQFRKQGKLLIKQDYQQSWLKSSFHKFYSRNNDVVSKYNLLLGWMLTDIRSNCKFYLNFFFYYLDSLNFFFFYRKKNAFKTDDSINCWYSVKWYHFFLKSDENTFNEWNQFFTLVVCII